MPKEYSGLSKRQKQRHRQKLLSSLNINPISGSQLPIRHDESVLGLSPSTNDIVPSTSHDECVVNRSPIIHNLVPSASGNSSTISEFSSSLSLSKPETTTEFVSALTETNDVENSSEDEEFLKYCCDNSSQMDLSTDLRYWALQRRINHQSLSHLLKILKKHKMDLPADARTLLQTPRKTVILTMEGGNYCHFGLKKNIMKSLEVNYENAPTLVKLNFNIDGLPLSSSSRSQFWPILGSLVEEFYTEVFPIGIYHGSSKPKNVNEYLKYFVDELTDVLENGVIFQGKNVQVGINAFVCDAPAKAYITCIKTHSGYFSCGKCVQEGDYVERRVVFTEIGSHLRTNESFRNRVQEEHHTGKSILEDILSLNMVSQFVLDYMHLVCLGVVKKIIRKSVRGKMNQRIKDLDIGPNNLTNLIQYIPMEFSRSPRKMEEYDNWKATEFRQFLLYTSILVLKDKMPMEKYSHFLSLSVAVRIMCSSRYMFHLNKARQLLEYFVKDFSNFYDLEDVSYNVHGLLHLADEVKSFGILDSFSSFKFENYMYKLKRLVETSGKPLEQVHNRIEEQCALPIIKRKQRTYPLLVCENVRIPILVFEHFRLRCCTPDNCVIVKSGEVGLIEQFYEENGDIKIEVRIFKQFQNFFNSPCNSLVFQIGRVKNNDLSPSTILPSSDIDFKCMRLMYDENLSLIIPIIHTFENQFN